MKKTTALLTLLIALTGSLSACGGDGDGGGDGGGRPSTAEIADALKDEDNAAGEAFAGTGASDEALDCIAEELHDSDLSDEALQAIVDGDEDFEGSKDDEAAIEAAFEDITACVV